MNKKFFVITEDPQPLSPAEIEQIEVEQSQKYNSIVWENREVKAKKAIEQSIPLKCTQGRVVVKIDVESKNSTTFSDGTVLRLERQFNNLNRRETEPVNAIVVDAANIPKDAEILIHHNSVHDSNRIFDCEDMVEGEHSADVRYYSIRENECFLWREGNGDWQPCTIFATALRVYKPYEGSLEGIPHTQLKNTLYVTSGELKGNVVSTVKASDFEIIFQDRDGKENRIIRFRPFGDKENDREEEAIAILDDITSLVKNGKYFVGLNDKDCEPIK